MSLSIILGGILHQSYVFSGIWEIIQELPYFVEAKTTIDFANHAHNFNNYIARCKASIADISQTTELVFPVYLLLF